MPNSCAGARIVVCVFVCVCVCVCNKIYKCRGAYCIIYIYIYAYILMQGRAELGVLVAARGWLRAVSSTAKFAKASLVACCILALALVRCRPLAAARALPLSSFLSSSSAASRALRSLPPLPSLAALPSLHLDAEASGRAMGTPVALKEAPYLALKEAVIAYLVLVEEAVDSLRASARGALAQQTSAYVSMCQHASACVASAGGALAEQLRRCWGCRRGWRLLVDAGALPLVDVVEHGVTQLKAAYTSSVTQLKAAYVSSVTKLQAAYTSSSSGMAGTWRGGCHAVGCAGKDRGTVEHDEGGPPPPPSDTPPPPPLQ